MEHIGSSVRLETAYTKRQADVAEIGRYIIVERLNLLDVGGLAFGQFSGAGTNLLVWLAALFFKTCVPAPHLLPTREGRHLDCRSLWLFGLLLLFLVFILVLVFVVFVNVRTAPCIDAASVLL